MTSDPETIIEQLGRSAREAARVLGASDDEQRSRALVSAAAAIRRNENEILQANA